MTNKEAQLNERYRQLMHAMQTGVAYEMERRSEPTSAKHLRVGVNSAMVNDAAAVKLLIDKGIFTMEEYLEALVEAAEKEVADYETKLSEIYGGRISLR